MFEETPLEQPHNRLPACDVLSEPVVAEAAAPHDLGSKTLRHVRCFSRPGFLRRRLGHGDTLWALIRPQPLQGKPWVQSPPSTRFECGHACAQLPVLLQQTLVLGADDLELLGQGLTRQSSRRPPRDSHQ